MRPGGPPRPRLTIAWSMMGIAALAILFALPPGGCAFGLVVLATWGIGAAINLRIARGYDVPSARNRISTILLRVAISLDVSAWLGMSLLYRSPIEFAPVVMLACSACGDVAFVLALIVIALAGGPERRGELRALAVLMTSFPMLFCLGWNVYLLLARLANIVP